MASTVETRYEPPLKVVLVFDPDDFDGVPRRHIVSEEYLSQCRTSTSFKISESDIEIWLQLRQPGVMYQTYPTCPIERVHKFQCLPADGNTPRHYLMPLQGGDFVATSAAEDLYPGAVPSPSLPGHAKEPQGDAITSNSAKRLGPDHTQTTSVFLPAKGKRRASPSYYRDEAYDLLDSGRWPHRIAHRPDKTDSQKSKSFADFARPAKKSFMVSSEYDSYGRRTLFHLVRPGRSHECQGAKYTKHGPRNVPEREKTHSGERATEPIIRQSFDIDSKLVRAKPHAFKRACGTCSLDLKLPKSTPPAYIVSENFGEKILVGCKTVHTRGCIIVAVDDFTSYTWTTFFKTKEAKPIAAFIGSIMKNVDTIREERPVMEKSSDVPSAMELYVSNKELQDMLQRDAEVEASKPEIYQSDNGRELENKEMAAEMVKAQAMMRHSRPHNPRMNGKAVNRVKAVFKTFFTELDARGGLSAANLKSINRSLESATAILNHRPESRSTYSPYEAAHHREAFLDLERGVSVLVGGNPLGGGVVRHMNNKIRYTQSSKALASMKQQHMKHHEPAK